MDEKYVVFKREDMVQGIGGWTGAHTAVAPLDDAVVIRTQDVFAAAGLHAYSQTITTHATLLRELYLTDGDLPPVVAVMISRLNKIADYFYDCAMEAEDRRARGESKLPD